MKYDENYYSTGNYTGYAESAGRYTAMARELIPFLKSVGVLLSPLSDRVVDFGCGYGFLISAFLTEGHWQTSGVDISKHALTICKLKKLEARSTFAGGDIRTRLTFALDVFEHICDGEIPTLVRQMKTDYLLVRIPVRHNTKAGFVLKSSQADKTHITCENKMWWRKMIMLGGMEEVCRLRLGAIYDSEGVYCALFRNEVCQVC